MPFNKIIFDPFLKGCGGSDGIVITTNNAAERAIRPAVIWRRISFGSQTQAGSTFVQRMMTVIITIKSQQRNVLEFLTGAVASARTGTTTPSLLPNTVDSEREKELLKAA